MVYILECVHKDTLEKKLLRGNKYMGLFPSPEELRSTYTEQAVLRKGGK